MKEGKTQFAISVLSQAAGKSGSAIKPAIQALLRLKLYDVQENVSGNLLELIEEIEEVRVVVSYDAK